MNLIEMVYHDVNHASFGDFNPYMEKNAIVWKHDTGAVISTLITKKGKLIEVSLTLATEVKIFKHTTTSFVYWDLADLPYRIYLPLMGK